MLVLLPVVAAAQPYPAVARYGDPLAQPPRSDLERRIEALTAELAKAERRTQPRPDARLERAVTAIASARREDDRGTPSNELVESALRLYGIVEPSPHLIVARASVGADDELLDELRTQLPRALGSGHYSRVGAAVVVHGESLRVVVALGDSYIELRPMPRELLNGGPTPLAGRLLGGFQRPSAFVTAPNGHADAISLGGDARSFTGTFRCGVERGRYQVEVAAEDRYGETVLANFPIYCGVAAPKTLDLRVMPREPPVTDAPAAEARLFALLNADRAHAGLARLLADPRLTDVARAHSRDMLVHDFVGHVSPTTGDASNRVARAKIPAQLILENVARAGTPGEVERGLMESPGHRRNILNADAKFVGIGVALAETLGGQKELIVTQLFTAPEASFRAARPDELRARIAELRRQRGLPAPLADPELDRIASSVAHDMADGRLDSRTAAPVIDRAMTPLGARYSAVRSVFSIATEIEQVAESLKGSLLTKGAIALGVGLAPGPITSDNGQRMAHHAVLLLATPR
ncbi:MAG: CAP domain-containing protein [Polyangia bacterium]